MKALANRMAKSDFGAWQQLTVKQSPAGTFVDDDTRTTQHNFPFVLEKRDGSLLRTSLSLDRPVDSILKSIATSLKLSGTVTLPDPPEPAKSRSEHVKPGGGASLASSTSQEHGVIDERYNVMSRRGRDLFRFLRQLESERISKLQSSRTDAQAAALAVRRLYQFQAVDATSLGWSSASIAVLLRQLLALHEEHAQKFHIGSFYPIRLVFTSDDFHTALDVHGGGLLRLNPASTPIQWLEALQLVTPEKIHEIQWNSTIVLKRTKELQRSLGLKFKKGYSCSNREYYCFLEHLAKATQQEDAETATKNNHEESTALTIEPIVATVESSQVSSRHRHFMVTKEGKIQLGAHLCRESFGPEAIRQALARHGHRAREQNKQHKRELELQQQAIHQAQWQLGLQKVYRTGIVSHDEFLECIRRLLSVASGATMPDMVKMGGNSLGIAGDGNFCHLADDGSLVIPHNWQ